MRTTGWLVLLLSILASAAHARCATDADCVGNRTCQQGACVDDPDLPRPSPAKPLSGSRLALIDRPLTLPARTFAPSVRLDIYNTSDSAYASGGTGESLALGLDVGVTDRFQVGIAAAIPVNPGAGFGTLLASGEFRLVDSVAVRLDVGYNRLLSSTTIFNAGAENNFVSGIGIPIKVRLHAMVAFVSGRSGASQYSPFLNINSNDVPPGSVTVYDGALWPIMGADLINFAYTSGTGGATYAYTLNLPVGIQFQPHERVALTARAAYTQVYSSVSIDGSSFRYALHYVPVGLDAVVTLLPQLDVGAAFFLPGPVAVGATAYTYNVASGSVAATHYADLRVISIFVNGRF